MWRGRIATHRTASRHPEKRGGAPPRGPRTSVTGRPRGTRREDHGPANLHGSRTGADQDLPKGRGWQGAGHQLLPQRPLKCRMNGRNDLGGPVPSRPISCGTRPPSTAVLVLNSRRKRHGRPRPCPKGASPPCKNAGFRRDRRSARNRADTVRALESPFLRLERSTARPRGLDEGNGF